ncbi:MAG: hypothetical protein KJ970_03180 [Candidatus Eisenbacteria bacterium]|uniref:ZU5 domain-containing protein n=1 Tax=Eiseniibacteriota bacterium TaxID=2212470 RepID=A0A948W511_UNCEI|nr:hypothetical protein [Candidatus Eisenbacteria bacterium]MBU1950024.1 hypothetical protein [Candidatus Eisenbacteria bacterium]MBU2689904.1 hypothetical protein [Candidatus Eisenbacteria bacterium]
MQRRTPSGHIGIFTAVVGLLIVLFFVGCGKDNDSTPTASAAEVSGESGPQFIFSPTAIQTSPLGDESTKTKSIKSDGGHLDVRGFKVIFPKDCLDEETDVTVSLLDEERLMIRIEPSDLVLNSPVSIEWDKLDRTDKKESEENSLVVLRADGNDWIPIPTQLDNKKLLAESDRLGDFALGRSSADTGDIEFVRYLSGPGYVTKLIDADKGGEVKYDRYKVKFPKYALDEDTYITVRDPGSDYLICELEPHGIVFNVPVELEMDFKDLDYIPFTDWTIWWFNDGAGCWENQGGTFAGEKLNVDLNHFSKYAAGRAGW